jgi:hypothetical protein
MNFRRSAGIRKFNLRPWWNGRHMRLRGARFGVRVQISAAAPILLKIRRSTSALLRIIPSYAATWIGDATHAVLTRRVLTDAQVRSLYSPPY